MSFINICSHTMVILKEQKLKTTKTSGKLWELNPWPLAFSKYPKRESYH